MANMNTIAGFYNMTVPITVNTANYAAVVPASGYPGYPSPVFAAGAGLAACCPPDIAGGELDGHPFKVRLTGTATTAGSYTFSFAIFQCPGTALGTIGVGTSTTNAVTTAGIITAGGSPCTIGPAASTATAISTTTANFMIELTCNWDSTSKVLSMGTYTGAWQKGVALAAPVPTLPGTQQPVLVTSVGLNDLNFMPGFTFGTAGANSVTIKEMVIDRM